jgi:thioredoxin-related protein
MRPSFITFFLFCVMSVRGADSLYHPLANAKEDITRVIAKAKAEKKHVLIQAGGNWCGWCIEFNRFIHADKQLDSVLNASFVVYHLNFSPQNKNYDIFKQYGFPNRFGFPVFLILNAEGQLIHTQNSSYLELGKSYDAKKVKEFFVSWTPAALEEKSYLWMNN